MVDLIHDPAIRRLGRAAPKRHPKLFRLSKYLALPTFPPERVWSTTVSDWGLMLNDKEGDCTIAGRGHHRLLRTTLAGDPQRSSDDQIQTDYIAITGQEGAAYDPSTGTNDNGCSMEDVLEYYRKNGQISAYAAVDPLNLDHVRFVIDAFEGCYVGVALPVTCQSQLEWDVVDPNLQGDSAPDSWGPHCVLLADYDQASFSCVTWGMVQKLTTQWWQTYANPKVGGEAYAVLSLEMVNGMKPLPSGFDLAALQADLAAL